MKIFTVVLGITLIITNTKTFFDAMSLSSAGGGTFWDILRAYFDILRQPFENRLICSHEILYRRSWCYFESHYIIFFSISWPCWEALGCIFGLILGNFPLILQNQSICCHETLYRYPWYNLDGYYIKKCFIYHVPHFCRPFWSIFGLIFAYLPLFLENC